MVAQCRPFMAALAEIPDFRKARGKRHPLGAVLAVVCAAILGGSRSYSAAAQRAHDYDPDSVATLASPIRTRPARRRCTRSSGTWDATGKYENHN
jgi:DDE_Tnp_1-associated